MSLLPPLIVFIDKCIEEKWTNLKGLQMLELGNQLVKNEFMGRQYTPHVSAETGKEYYRSRGLEHTSIDLNGEDGALALDLSQPLPADIPRGKYDVITNAGTTEHIEPLASQYDCFKTIHDLTKLNGLMIHFVPGPKELKTSGYWKFHCNNYYPMEFFELLSRENGYRIVHQTLMEDLITVCLEKTVDKEFMSDRALLCSPIVRKDWGIVYEGINDNGVSKLKAFAFKVMRKLHMRQITYKNLRKQQT